VAQRTGVPTLLRVAMELCKYITQFTPTITRLYPDNAALLAALAAANVACSALAAALSEVREYGD
jgi:hypothetical protein